MQEYCSFFSAAWVHRGFTDDVTEVTTVAPGGDKLSDFQKDKFRHFFTHVLDLNSDYVISAEDFDKLNEVRIHSFRRQTLFDHRTALRYSKSKTTISRKVHKIVTISTKVK